MSDKITETFHCKRNLKIESSEPINQEDISVDTSSNNKIKSTSSKPNSLALAILWAHFQAYEQGLLTTNSPAPWEMTHESTESLTPEQKLWLQFLENIITDSNWISWIQNPEEIRKHSIEAYNKIQPNNDNVANVKKTKKFSLKQSLCIEFDLNIQIDTEEVSITCSSDSNNYK